MEKHESRSNPAPYQLLNETQVAGITSLKVSTLQKLRLRKEGPPFVKIGRKVAYRVADLTGWLDALPAFGVAA